MKYPLFNATHYYQWGDERPGYVTIGYYHKKAGWVNLGHIPKDTATGMGLTYHCPYP